MPWGTPQVKLAICIKSCHKDLEAGFHDAIRGTWGKDAKALGIDVFFFMGKDPTQQSTRRLWRYSPGEIVVDSDDSYEALPYKTRRICQWASAKLFTNLFLCDVDTFVRPKQLLNTGFESYDYAGQFLVGEPGGAPFHYSDQHGAYDDFRGWASGGFGYFLSKKAAAIVAGTPPNVWAEDAYVGQTLAPFIDDKEITSAHLDLKLMQATEHFGKNLPQQFTPKILQEAYQHGGFRALYVKGLYVA